MTNKVRLIDANTIPWEEHYVPDIDSDKQWDYKKELCVIKPVVDKIPTVDAVEVNRLGKLGRLMMPYKGDPRGNMGAKGCSGGDFRAIELDPITDIDGNRWIPVLEEDLCAMKARADDTVEVVHGRWLYDSGSGKYFCSACDENALSFKKDTIYGGDLYEVCLTDYCPNCGAKMDKE